MLVGSEPLLATVVIGAGLTVIVVTVMTLPTAAVLSATAYWMIVT